MPRRSGYRGTWEPNRRPYVTLTPDVYVAIQGETSVLGCGECKRRLNINKYITGVSTEGSVDSPPGSATINLSIPDNQINEFYANDQFLLISMMEVEIYAKGYYTIGGFPQYYKIFWGLINSVSQNWSNGVTTVSITCKDILRWWELTSVIINPAFLDIGKSASNYNLFANRFSATNPYAVILTLAREAMGDFSITQGSFTSWRPEDGPERGVVTSYARSVMLYWQLKFGKIWNNLVLYGSSGTAYSFAGSGGNVSPLKIYNLIFRREKDILDRNQETETFRIQPNEIATFKRDFTKAGDVDFFQNESQTKLQLALTARDQAGAYEFYCDTTGDIIFKPPFFNLNTMPNKPVSWVQDFEIIDESITESEQEVFTHVTSSGNAFGGVNDYGIGDEITTPRTGAIDWHLVRRYGWRRLNLQLEWPGNMRKLFYHCLDHMDKINARRIRGTMTIPMRPELRMGFPIWIPKHDAFFYVSGIAHTYAPGGMATTQLTLTAKRSKFIAPKNIGRITRNKRPQSAAGDAVRKKQRFISKTQKEAQKRAADQERLEAYQGKVSKNHHHYIIEFPSGVGGTSGLTPAKPQGNPPPADKSTADVVDGSKKSQTSADEGVRFDEPAILRNIKTGKILGFPNAVMVYRTTVDREVVAQIMSKDGTSSGKKGKTPGNRTRYDLTVRTAMQLIEQGRRAAIIDRLRLNRYEAGFTNAGAYDYAHDVSGDFKEISVVPTDYIYWLPGGIDPTSNAKDSKTQKIKNAQAIRTAIVKLEDEEASVRQELREAIKKIDTKKKELDTKQKAGQTDASPWQTLTSSKSSGDAENDKINDDIQALQNDADKIETKLLELETKLSNKRKELSLTRRLKAMNIIIRPVSDEYGFEVIGHYRYGRGAFVEKGQIQVSTGNENVVNQLDIQFSPTGGLLTDNTAPNNLGPESHSFAEAYERMMPDDFVTGASFKGGNYTRNAKGDDEQLKEVQAITQASYYKSISDTKNTRTGQPVFVESDSLRRAETLAELKPNLSSLNMGGKDIFTNCACGLVKTSWVSVLPQELIRRMMQIIPPSPVQNATASTTVAGPPKEEVSDEDSFRDYFVRVAASKAGLNFVDTPVEFMGLLQSPGDVKYYNSGTQKWFSTPYVSRKATTVDKIIKTIGSLVGVNVNRTNRGTSTCGLVVRGIMREAGLNPKLAPEFYGPYADPEGRYKGPWSKPPSATDEALEKIYKNGTRPPGLAISEVVALAKHHDAWVDGKTKDPLPKRGDIVVVGGWVDNNAKVEHIFTLLSDIEPGPTSLTTGAIDGVDGGNTVYDPKDDSTDKQACKFVPRPGGWTRSPGGPGGERWAETVGHRKRVQGWVNIEVLRQKEVFSGGEIDFKQMEDDPERDLIIGQDPYGANEAIETVSTLEGGVAVAQGNGTLFSLEPDGFLEVLHIYLRERFQRDYQKNQAREQFAIHGGKEIFAPNMGFEQDNVLSQGNTLFDRASAGDPDALNALRNEANYNFGQSEKALEEFKDQFKEGGKIDQLSERLSDQVGNLFDPSSGNFLNPAVILTGGQDPTKIGISIDGEPVGEDSVPSDGESTGEATDASTSASTSAPAPTSPLDRAIADKQKPGASTTAIKTIKLPPSLQTGQHQPSTQPMVLPIPLNTGAVTDPGLLANTAGGTERDSDDT